MSTVCNFGTVAGVMNSAGARPYGENSPLTLPFPWNCVAMTS